MESFKSNIAGNCINRISKMEKQEDGIGKEKESAARVQKANFHLKKEIKIYQVCENV